MKCHMILGGVFAVCQSTRNGVSIVMKLKHDHFWLPATVGSQYSYGIVVSWCLVQQTMSMGIVRKKAKIRNRYDQVRKLTLDTVWESDKNTRNQGSQEVSPFPTGNHKAARNIHGSMAWTNFN